VLFFVILTEVDVVDLVDGSKPRLNVQVPATADAQPGYYLSCAVGGQTSGNPSQQGFTNMPIVGISRIYGSSDYFSERQITLISNGGVYVFEQEIPESLPTSVHALTTDVSTLDFSEYMAVKNYDYVSRLGLKALAPFIGSWNNLRETRDFMRSAINATYKQAQKNYVAKIGSPITKFIIKNVSESDIAKDRSDVVVDVNLPTVLNTIGLYLVA
jgi:hypothetical protein